MTETPVGKRVVPTVLGLAMLVVVVAAGIAPNTGAIPAQTDCQYGVCPSTQPTFPSWAIIAGVAGAIFAAALLAGFFVYRRRRPPAAPAAGPLEAWEEPGGGPEEGGEAAVDYPQAGETEEYAGTPAEEAYPPTGAESEYAPPPEGTEYASPAEPPAPEVVPEPEVPPPVPPKGTEAINGLMADIQRLSGETSKTPAKKKPGGRV